MKTHEPGGQDLSDFNDTNLRTHRSFSGKPGMIRPIMASIALRIRNLRHGEASLRLRKRRSDWTVTPFEPSINLMPNVVDNPRPAAMIIRPDAIHAPFGERRATDAEILSGFYSSKPIVSIGCHHVLPSNRVSENARDGECDLPRGELK